MISGIASPLIARPPTMPPAGPTGRWSASTAPPNTPATRAASLNDMAASGPPSDTDRIDLIIAHAPPKRSTRRFRHAGYGIQAQSKAYSVRLEWAFWPRGGQKRLLG